MTKKETRDLYKGSRIPQGFCILIYHAAPYGGIQILFFIAQYFATSVVRYARKVILAFIVSTISR